MVKPSKGETFVKQVVDIKMRSILISTIHFFTGSLKKVESTVHGLDVEALYTRDSLI